MGQYHYPQMGQFLIGGDRLLLSKRVDGWKEADQKADRRKSFYRNNEGIKENGRRECGGGRMGLPRSGLLEPVNKPDRK
jgi:hypothetical protein